MPERLFVFECGATTYNPVRKSNTYACPDCGYTRKNRCRVCATVILCCICGDEAVAGPKAWKKKYCPKCARDINSERSNKRIKTDAEIIKSMTPDERLTGDQYDRYLSEVAVEFNISRERARQIYNMAKYKFKKQWRKMYPDLPNPVAD